MRTGFPATSLIDFGSNSTLRSFSFVFKTAAAGSEISKERKPSCPHRFASLFTG